MKFNTKKIEIAILLLFCAGVLFAQERQQTFELVGQQIQLYGEFEGFEEDVKIEKISEVEKGTIELTEGTYTFDIPTSGLISFKAAN